jgi:hypothetical protein
MSNRKASRIESMLGNQIYCSILYRTKCNKGNFQKLEQFYRLKVDCKPVFGNWLSRFPQNQKDPLVMHVYLDNKEKKEDAHKLMEIKAVTSTRAKSTMLSFNELLPKYIRK